MKEIRNQLTWWQWLIVALLIVEIPVMYIMIGSMYLVFSYIGMLVIGFGIMNLVKPRAAFGIPTRGRAALIGAAGVISMCGFGMIGAQTLAPQTQGEVVAKTNSKQEATRLEAEQQAKQQAAIQASKAKLEKAKQELNASGSAKTIPAGFTAEAIPAVAKVGEKLIFKLGIENRGSEPIQGARIHTSGKWSDFSVVNVTSGTFEQGFDLEGSNVLTGMPFEPGAMWYVQMVTYPKKAGTYTFTFTPFGADTTRLVDASGQNIPVTVSVTVR